MAQFDDKQKERIVHLIETLLVEPKIRESVTRDFVPHKKEYKHVLIVIERSKIYFAKYSWGGIGTFANNLIKCYEEVSFSDFFIKTWDALVDMTVGTPAHKAVLEGLSRETLLKGIHGKEYDYSYSESDKHLAAVQVKSESGYPESEDSRKDINNAEKSVCREHCKRINKIDLGP